MFYSTFKTNIIIVTEMARNTNHKTSDIQPIGFLFSFIWYIECKNALIWPLNKAPIKVLTNYNVKFISEVKYNLEKYFTEVLIKHKGDK